MEMPSPWSYSSVPPGPEMGSISGVPPGAVVDEPSGDGDAVAAVVFKRAAGPGDGVQPRSAVGRRAAGTACADGAGVAVGVRYVIEQEVALLDGPAVVPAHDDAVDFLDG